MIDYNRPTRTPVTGAERNLLAAPTQNAINQDLPTYDPADPSSMQMAILQNQWQDYLDRFAPFEDMAIANIADPARREQLRNQALTAGERVAGAAADQTAARANRQRQRMNITLTPEESRLNQRQNDFARATAVTTARNAVRSGIEDRENLALFGG